MRSFLAFAGLIVLTLAAAALLAWPAHSLLAPYFDVRFHRVASRLWMLLLLAGFLLVARRLRVADRASLGYGLPRSRFLRETLVGLGLGVLTMTPIVLLMHVLGLREPRADLALDATAIVSLLLGGLTTGLVVALIEETFLRGAMHTGIQRESGAALAVALTALVYAATHFLASHRIPPEQLGPGSGFELLAGSLAAFGRPLVIADAFLCLAGVGVLLGMVRTLTGNIAACIGLHAGWVWVITFARETSRVDDANPLRFLLSGHDGVVGWMVLAWTAVIGAVLFRVYRRRGVEVAAGQA
jgi:uncharacterized protein